MFFFHLLPWWCQNIAKTRANNNLTGLLYWGMIASLMVSVIFNIFHHAQADINTRCRYSNAAHIIGAIHKLRKLYKGDMGLTEAFASYIFKIFSIPFGMQGRGGMKFVIWSLRNFWMAPYENISQNYYVNVLCIAFLNTICYLMH